MAHQNHQTVFGFRQELEQTMKYHRRRAGAFKAQARRAPPNGHINEEMRACRLKIAKVYDDLADVIENRLFREW